MTEDTKYSLDDNSRVGVIGAGPAGSFFSYFLLDIAERIDMKINLDLYEAKDFTIPGPAGCNNCAGIISESLVQTLASEGINLPPDVVKTGIDRYVLHTDTGSVDIDTPLHEMRIAAVHRGSGPRGITDTRWKSFDGFLMNLAGEKGANIIHERIGELGWQDGFPIVKTKNKEDKAYDLLVIGTGVNSTVQKLMDSLDFGYQAPKATKTYICELYLGEEMVNKHLGNAVHLFLLDIPRVDFAMLIPKVEFATFCMLGNDIDTDLVQTTLNTPEVRSILPPGWKIPENYCHCSPKATISDPVHAFTNRVITLGDCGFTRLYKDGIGAAYKSAKAAAVTAIFDGVSREDFDNHFQKTCRAISHDNRFGRIIFAVTHTIQRKRFMRSGVVKTVKGEQKKKSGARHLSTVFWDTFTGSAPYRDVFFRTLHPVGLSRLVGNMITSLFTFNRQ